MIDKYSNELMDDINEKFHITLQHKNGFWKNKFLIRKEVKDLEKRTNELHMLCYEVTQCLLNPVFDMRSTYYHIAMERLAELEK